MGKGLHRERRRGNDILPMPGMSLPPEQTAREREKARELRKSQWWKNELAKGKCHYCGGTFPSDELTMDHVIPVARGGRSEKGNVVPACKECNNKKKYLTPVEQVLVTLDHSGEEMV